MLNGLIFVGVGLLVGAISGIIGIGGGTFLIPLLIIFFGWSQKLAQGTTLAMMIPPSGLAVLIAAIAEVSVGKVLMAIIIPGLVLVSIYTIFILGRCLLQPSLVCHSLS